MRRTVVSGTKAGFLESLDDRQRRALLLRLLRGQSPAWRAAFLRTGADGFHQADGVRSEMRFVAATLTLLGTQ